MTTAELKAEMGKLEGIMKTLRDAHCKAAVTNVEPRLHNIRTMLRSRMPVTQRLEQLMAKVRRAQQLKDKASDALEDLLQKVCLAEECQRETSQQLEEAEHALGVFKEEMLEKKPIDVDKENTHEQLQACLDELAQQVPAQLIPLTRTLKRHIAHKKFPPGSVPLDGDLEQSKAVQDAKDALSPTLVDTVNKDSVSVFETQRAQLPKDLGIRCSQEAVASAQSRFRVHSISQPRRPETLSCRRRRCQSCCR